MNSFPRLLYIDYLNMKSPFSVKWSFALYSSREMHKPKLNSISITLFHIKKMSLLIWPPNEYKGKGTSLIRASTADKNLDVSRGCSDEMSYNLTNYLLKEDNLS